MIVVYSNSFRILIARFWLRRGDAEQAPPADGGAGEMTGIPPQNLAGRWPDAASLLAHRMKALQRDRAPCGIGDRRD